MSKRTWQGRLDGVVDPDFIQLSHSIHFDHLLLEYDLAVGVAHVSILRSAKLITAAEEKKLTAAIRRMQREVRAGKLTIDWHTEDIHTWVENRLTRSLGPLGAKLHTGRSRNDLVVTDLRLFLRDQVEDFDQLLRKLQRALLRQANPHSETVLPGYTHGQPAQIVSLAHHLLAYIEMFGRDRERLADLYPRLNICPLGSGALAGSTLPLDRKAAAQKLGFDQPAANSMDAVSDRDFVIEFLNTAALTGIHLSRWAAEWINWSAERGFVRVPDAFCTGSSMMPQKRNPDALELIRGKCSRLLGNQVTVTTLLKGLPLTYYRDLQEDKEPLFDTIWNLRLMLRIAAKIIAGATFDPQAMAAAATDPFLQATDLVEMKVLDGEPFRPAYRRIGRQVSQALTTGETLDGTGDAAAALRRRNTLGGPGPRQVKKELKRWQQRLK